MLDAPEMVGPSCFFFSTHSFSLYNRVVLELKKQKHQVWFVLIKVLYIFCPILLYEDVPVVSTSTAILSSNHTTVQTLWLFTTNYSHVFSSGSGDERGGEGGGLHIRSSPLL